MSSATLTITVSVMLLFVFYLIQTTASREWKYREENECAATGRIKGGPPHARPREYYCKKNNRTYWISY